MSDALPSPHDNGRHPVTCLHERDWSEFRGEIQMIAKRQNSLRMRTLKQDGTLEKFGDDLKSLREEFKEFRDSLSAKALMGNLGQALSVIMTVITLWLIATGKR